MSPAPSEVVTVEGDEVVATLPEGTRRAMKLPDLLKRMTTGMPDTGDIILCDGTKCMLPTAEGVVLVHQTPPQVYSFQWIAADSEADYGPQTSYRTVRLALPYVIVLAVFERVGRNRGRIMLSGRNECFFVNEPLEVKGMKTPLAYPSLLNCSKMGESSNGPLSWICTQHLSFAQVAGRKTDDDALRAGLTALLRHLLESGFNRSSENHEGASGFSATIEAAIDPRIESVESWEAATREDPLFVLEVPWLPTGRTLEEVVARIDTRGRGRARTMESAADVARMIFSVTNKKGSGKK
jgi:hypothetical protein